MAPPNFTPIGATYRPCGAKNLKIGVCVFHIAYRRFASHRVACSVCRCQCVTLMSPAKTAETIKLPFTFRTRVGPMNHVLHDIQMPTWEGAILRGKQANHCKQYRHSAVVCAKTAEPIEDAQVQLYSPGGANVPLRKDTLPSPVE